MMKKFAGIDVQAMYPAHPSAPEAADWTYDTFLKAAEACHKAGYPFGIGLRHDDGLGPDLGRDLRRLRR